MDFRFASEYHIWTPSRWLIRLHVVLRSSWWLIGPVWTAQTSTPSGGQRSSVGACMLPSNGLCLPVVDSGGGGQSPAGLCAMERPAPGVRVSKTTHTARNGVHPLPTCGTPRCRRPADPPSRSCRGDPGLGAPRDVAPQPTSSSIDCTFTRPGAPCDDNIHTYIQYTYIHTYVHTDGKTRRILCEGTTLFRRDFKKCKQLKWKAREI